MVFRVVDGRDPLRGRLEDEIKLTYRERFAAHLKRLPGTLIANVSHTGAIECAAGVHFHDSAFFSERYLDLPIDMELELRLGRPVRREHVVEICHLVARKPGSSLQFVSNIIAFAVSVGAQWAIFTATGPLRALLAYRGLAMLDLGRADRRRVSNPSEWGSYYEHDPRVMAVSRSSTVRYRPARGSQLVQGSLIHA